MRHIMVIAERLLAARFPGRLAWVVTCWMVLLAGCGSEEQERRAAGDPVSAGVPGALDERVEAFLSDWAVVEARGALGWPRVIRRRTDMAVMTLDDIVQFLQVGGMQGTTWHTGTAVYRDVFPVSNRMYEAFVEATGYVTEAEARGEAPKVLEDGTYGPVTKSVSWRHPGASGSSGRDWGEEPVVVLSRKDAEAYARWANAQVGEFGELMEGWIVMGFRCMRYAVPVELNRVGPDARR